MSWAYISVPFKDLAGISKKGLGPSTLDPGQAPTIYFRRQIEIARKRTVQGNVLLRFSLPGDAKAFGDLWRSETPVHPVEIEALLEWGCWVRADRMLV